MSTDGRIKGDGFLKVKLGIVAAKVRANNRHADLTSLQFRHYITEQITHPGYLKKGGELQGDKDHTGFLQNN
jgi:hypothetical protein